MVTGNLAHYPPGARAGATVLSPAELVERYRAALAGFQAAMETGLADLTEGREVALPEAKRRLGIDYRQ